MDAGTFLRKSRLQKRLSMEAVANKIGITYQAYQNYEINKVKLVNPILFKICGVLEIDPCDVLKSSTTDYTFMSTNLVMDSEAKYLTLNIKQLMSELRERDELIGALKYQINQLKNKEL